jgi:hypothetical protein
VQRKAQEEIDAVTGSSRLPNFGDREKLPYVSALMKELLRWHVAGPMGMCVNPMTVWILRGVM